MKFHDNNSCSGFLFLFNSSSDNLCQLCIAFKDLYQSKALTSKENSLHLKTACH